MKKVTYKDGEVDIGDFAGLCVDDEFAQFDHTSPPEGVNSS